MARTKNPDQTSQGVDNTLTQGNLSEEVPAEDLDGSADGAEAMLKDFQAQFNGKSFRVRMEKFDPTEHDWSWCERMPLEGFDPFTVVKKYGPGRYRAILLDDRGRYVKGGIMKFSFASPPASVEEAKPATPLTDPIVQFMLKAQSDQTAMLQNLLTTLLTSGAQTKQTDVGQLIGALKDLKALTPEDRGGSKSLQDALALARQVQELTALGKGGEDRGEAGSGILGEIREALKLVSEIRQVAPAAAAPARAPGAPTSVVSVNGGVIVHKKSGGPDMPAAAKKALFYVQKFVEAAKEDGDVETWADCLLGILEREVVPSLAKEYRVVGVDEDDIWKRLIKAAKDQEQVDKLFAYAPPLDPYRAWVRAVVAKAVELTEEEPERLEPAAPADVIVTDGNVEA